MTLTEFLLARIAEDEATAQGASWGNPGYSEWRLQEGGLQAMEVQAGDPESPTAITCDYEGTSDSVVTREAGVHIATWDPARVLRRCEADRRIVEEARDYSPELSDGDNGEWALGMVLAHLAAVYADHPDYDDEWKP